MLWPIIKLNDSKAVITPMTQSTCADIFLVTQGNLKYIWKKSTTNSLSSEVKSLLSISDTQTISVPKVYFHDEMNILMDYIPPAAPMASMNRNFGTQLALLHKSTRVFFGGEDSGYIGPSPQKNILSSNWVEFFIQHRLSPQFQRSPKEIQFQEKNVIKHFLKNSKNVKFRPSLIHGDLWSGNILFSQRDIYLIDPASYYADHEAEFGIYLLFTTPQIQFWEGYNFVLPFKNGFKERLPVYKLYHALNHLNSFGQTYRSLVNDILTEIF